MNYRQLQYALLLSKERSFSQVAESLEISQPALSKQIISLENELGVKLFDRSTTPLTLTAAGEFFVDKAQELLFAEDVLRKTMERYKSGTNGKLHIGISPFRSLYLMPPLVKVMRAAFPGLQIVLHEYGRTQLLKGLSEGLYDFIVTNLPVEDASLEAFPLEKDIMVLAVPNHLLHTLDDKCRSASAIHLSDCSRLPFAVMHRDQEMRQLFDKLCKLAHMDPMIHVEVTGMTTAWEMTKAGIAATLLPRQFIQADLPHADVTLFDLSQDAYVRQPAIVIRRGQYVSKHAEFALDWLTNKTHN